MKKILAFTLAFLLVLPGFMIWGATDEGYGEDETALGQFVDSFENEDNIAVLNNVIVNATVEGVELYYDSGVGGGWLAGWDLRVKLTIDENDIDSALSDFPVLIYISSSSGRNNEDVTFIFDEVGANSLKIAVTESDGTTELYVEIEEWDLGNEEAWLWSSIPSIASGSDTDIYFYYDNDHADNVAHVGIKESASGENVWDSDFLMVQHMDEASGNIKDSTSEDRDGTQGQTPTYGQTGEIDGSIAFDGATTTGDYFQLADHADLSFNAFTLDVWVYLHDKGVDNANDEHVAAKSGTAGNREWQFNLNRASGGNPYKVRPIIGKADGNWGITSFFSTGTVALNAWKHIAITWDGTTIKIYLEGAFDSQVGYSDTIKDTGSIPYIARGDTTHQFLDGLLDEFRLSSIARASEWIKATFETGRDDFFDWGLSETSSGYFTTEDYLDQVAGAVLVQLTNATIPEGTGITVQFSADNSTWVNNLNIAGSNTVTAGFQAIDLRELNWSSSYYLRYNFTGGIDTPRLYQSRLITTEGALGPGLNVSGVWIDYNVSAINASVGVVDGGNLSSVFFIDGNTFNVSEVGGVPGMVISLNFTGVDPDAECLWVTFWYLYDGNQNHDFDIEMWNFTSSAWVDDGHLIDGVAFSWTNSTIYAIRIPIDFLSGGEVRVQLNHESPGNMNHDLFIDYIRLVAKIPAEPAAGDQIINIVESDFPWIAIAIILMLVAYLLLSRLR